MLPTYNKKAHPETHPPSWFLVRVTDVLTSAHTQALDPHFNSNSLVSSLLPLPRTALETTLNSACHSWCACTPAAAAVAAAAAGYPCPHELHLARCHHQNRVLRHCWQMQTLASGEMGTDGVSGARARVGAGPVAVAAADAGSGAEAARACGQAGS